MKSCLDGFFEESGQTFRKGSPGGERFLTDAEIEELLRDLPAQVVAFCREMPRTHSRIA